MSMDKKNKIFNELRHYAVIIIGTAILSFGLFNIHFQSNITEGGVLGMTLLINNLFGIRPGISGIIIDSICYFLGYKYLGKAFLKNAVVATIGFSLFYTLFESIGFILPEMTAVPLMAAIIGGLFVGVGVGLVVSEGGASGGDDALALIISRATKCKIAKAYLATDFTVLILSISYISKRNIILSLVTVMISSFIIGKIQIYDITKQKATGVFP